MGTDRPLRGESAGASWTVTTGGGTTVVALVGEVDLAAVRGPSGALLDTLKRSIAGDDVVVCDLSGVDYMDSSGFHLLVQLKRDVERANGRFLLARPSEPVRQLLQIVGVEEFFDIQG